jgi:hypothetical protein
MKEQNITIFRFKDLKKFKYNPNKVANVKLVQELTGLICITWKAMTT